MLARVAHCPNRPPPDRPGQQRQALPGQQARLVVIAELPRSLRAAQCRAYRVELPGVSQALRSADEDDDQVPTAHAEDYWLPPGELSQIDRTGGKGDHDVFRCLGCTRAECKGPAGCMATAWRLEPGGYLRHILNARVYDIAIETPLEIAKKLSEEMGNTILLKREDLQVFSFKVRGAFNFLAHMSEEERRAGVICASAGNHAQGVAMAARHLGCQATICMPPTTTPLKIDAVRRLGAEIELVGATYAEAQVHAQMRAAVEGKVFISAFDHPLIIAGQGTMGLEILRHCPAAQRARLHAIFVPVGGGGMAAGIAALVKAADPSILVIGVEPTGANKMAISLKRGERVSLEQIDVFADGVAIKRAGAECFRLCRDLLDGILMVDNAAISAGIKDVFSETRTILEPAGAVAVAGAKAYLAARPHIKGASVVAVCSGANINFDRLRLVAELADLGAHREAMLTTTLSGELGTLRRFAEAAVAGTQLNITELRHRYIEGRPCHVLWSVGLRQPADLPDLLARLDSQGFPSRDISAIQAAQVHLRHLVGGRARGSRALAHERLYEVQAPERLRAISQLLDALSPVFNMTLFHYRKTGARLSPILLGLQVPPGTKDALVDITEELKQEGFSCKELTDEAERVLDMFLQ